MVPGPLLKHPTRGCVHRCAKKGCQKFTHPHADHPLFAVGRGSQFTSLKKQAAILFCLVNEVAQARICNLLGANHKAISRLSANLDELRMASVLHRQDSITFGGDDDWVDVEADEAVVRT